MVARKASDDEVRAALAGRTVAQAAELLGMHERRVYERKARLARQGWSPEHDMTKTVPDGFHLKGTSTLYDEDGKPRLQWVKTSIDHERQRELFLQAAQSMAAELPQVDSVACPIKTLPHLMAVYPIGDAHIGMRAWGEETQGDSWDMTEAVRVQCGAMAALVDLAPAADQGVIINLGDWLHADNMEGMTSRSGHVMDLDGRYAKMIDVGMMVMRQCIASALQKHKTVRVINVVGNHDDTGALWMSVALRHAYEHEPRVQIDKSPAAFHYIEHGKVLIGTHHGHKVRPGERGLPYWREHLRVIFQPTQVGAKQIERALTLFSGNCRDERAIVSIVCRRPEAELLQRRRKEIVERRRVL